MKEGSTFWNTPKWIRRSNGLAIHLYRFHLTRCPVAALIGRFSQFSQALSASSRKRPSVPRRLCPTRLLFPRAPQRCSSPAGASAQNRFCLLHADATKRWRGRLGLPFAPPFLHISRRHHVWPRCAANRMPVLDQQMSGRGAADRWIRHSRVDSITQADIVDGQARFECHAPAFLSSVVHHPPTTPHPPLLQGQSQSQSQSCARPALPHSSSSSAPKTASDIEHLLTHTPTTGRCLARIRIEDTRGYERPS